MSGLPPAHPRPLGLKRSGSAALLGFLAASWQIFLVREFAAHFFGSELTFGFVLAAWLLGGGIGGLRARRRPLRSLTLGGLFDAALLAAPVVFAAIRLSRWILGTLPGEVTGLLPILGYALASAFVLNVPLGAAFVRALEGAANDVRRIYFWESAGAAAGGLVSTFLLVPLLSNWEALAVLEIAAAAAVFFGTKKRRRAAWSIAAALLGVGLVAFDRPVDRLVWKPYVLAAGRDSLQGKLQVVRDAEQVTFYENGWKSFSVPDPAGAEETVHFALLQKKDLRSVLLIGGGLGGGLGEILKYPGVRIDYVESDPAVLQLAARFLGPAERSAFSNPRVRAAATDGRIFLQRSPGGYDAILLDLPEPATALINRYFTLEFFRLARSRLAPGGVLSFKAGAGEGSMSDARRRLLATLAATAGAVFPRVGIVPGDNAVFLASDRELDLDPESLARALRSRGIATVSLSGPALDARLHPFRRARMSLAVKGGAGRINSDLRPICYFFHAVLWSGQTGGLESNLLRALAAVPPAVLLGVPLVFLAVLLLGARLRRRPETALTATMAMMGLTTMAVEVMVVVWYQSLYGSFYGRVALLLTAVMAGLAAGAVIARGSLRRLALLQAAFLLLLGAAAAASEGTPPEAFFFLFLGAWGTVGGSFFVSGSRLWAPGARAASRGYAWDLLGSFGGAVVLSAVVLPLAGLAQILGFLIALNALVLLFILSRPAGPSRL